MEFITIATQGDSQDFGDTPTNNGQQPHAGGNSIRGVWMGGSNSSAISSIKFVTIATKGNAVNFGDTTITRRYNPSGPSDQVRMLATRGGSSDSGVNTIDMISISTGGDATDFGDLTQARTGISGCSNAHGGLG